MACCIARNILGVLLLSNFSLGSNLTAIRVNDKLPIPMYGMSVFYDGVSDFIYLFGGADYGNSKDSILRFDISTEDIERVGTLPGGSYLSPGVQDFGSDLFYFSAANTVVYKFKTADNMLYTAGSLAAKPFLSASAKNSAGNVLIFGGSIMRSKITEVEIMSGTVISSEIVGEMSEPFQYTVCVQLANNTALVFGTGGRVPYLILNLETLESRNVTTNGFPQFQSGMTVTSDQQYVYAFGGNIPGIPTNGIIRLELATNTWESISVDDFPTQGNSSYEDAPAVVWVEKQNRIYMFGGCSENSSAFNYLDDIWYIDLNPLNPITPTVPTTTEEPPTTSFHPDLFSCDNRTDGPHPHPSDCSEYIACSNGTVEGVHPCPPPLLYDPLLETCNLPSLVDCTLNCENREDGIYPHPRECNLFIICSQRDLFVFWCDPPLVFDPLELKCNLPGLVTCASS